MPVLNNPLTRLHTEHILRLSFLAPLNLRGELVVQQDVAGYKVRRIASPINDSPE